MQTEVDHPPHYNTDAGIEVIDVIELYGFEQSFKLGNAVKYIMRAGRKASTTRKRDLEKALWYMDRFKLMLDDGAAVWPRSDDIGTALDTHPIEKILSAFSLIGNQAGALQELLAVGVYDEEEDSFEEARGFLVAAIAECQ